MGERGRLPVFVLRELLYRGPRTAPALLRQLPLQETLLPAYRRRNMYAALGLLARWGLVERQPGRPALWRALWPSKS